VRSWNGPFFSDKLEYPIKHTHVPLVIHFFLFQMSTWADYSKKKGDWRSIDYPMSAVRRLLRSCLKARYITSCEGFGNGQTD
jgi:hypothetical protein